MSQKQLSANLKKLLGEVILKHKPVLLHLLESIGHKPLTIEQREELREIIATELCESGLDANDQPNERGLLLEELIDCLGHF